MAEKSKKMRRRRFLGKILVPAVVTAGTGMSVGTIINALIPPPDIKDVCKALGFKTPTEMRHYKVMEMEELHTRASIIASSITMGSGGSQTAINPRRIPRIKVSSIERWLPEDRLKELLGGLLSRYLNDKEFDRLEKYVTFLNKEIAYYKKHGGRPETLTEAREALLKDSDYCAKHPWTKEALAKKEVSDPETIRKTIEEYTPRAIRRRIAYQEKWEPKVPGKNFQEKVNNLSTEDLKDIQEEVAHHVNNMSGGKAFFYEHQEKDVSMMLQKEMAIALKKLSTKEALKEFERRRDEVDAERKGFIMKDGLKAIHDWLNKKDYVRGVKIINASHLEKMKTFEEREPKLMPSWVRREVDRYVSKRYEMDDSRIWEYSWKKELVSQEESKAVWKHYKECLIQGKDPLASKISLPKQGKQPPAPTKQNVR